MTFIGALFVPGAFWAGVYLFSRSLAGRTWLKRKNVEASAVSLSWSGTAISDALARWRVSARPSVISGLRLWFSIGSMYGTLAMAVVSVSLCCNAFFQVSTLWTLVSRPAATPLSPEDMAAMQEAQLLTPVLPGLNLPVGHAFYFIVAIAVNAALHELGHAVAALCYGVRVNGFGAFLYFVYPGAVCDLNTEDLRNQSPKQQYQIFTAGVFHNLVIAIAAALCMFLLVPAALPLAYASGLGAVVADVHKESVVYGHLPVGSHITGLNGGACRVQTAADFYSCIGSECPAGKEKSRRQRVGYCTASSDVADNTWTGQGDPPNGDCCADFTGGGPARFCFAYNGLEEPQRYACLPARKTGGGLACTSNKDCAGGSKQAVEGEEPGVCAFPVVERGSCLVRIDFDRNSRGEASDFVLYTGHPHSLAAGVYATDLSPRWSFAPVKLPQRVDTLLRYMTVLSLALSFMNIVPAFRLDGHYALCALLDNFNLGEWATLGVFMGTMLLAFNIVMSFVLMIVL